MSRDPATAPALEATAAAWPWLTLRPLQPEPAPSGDAVATLTAADAEAPPAGTLGGTAGEVAAMRLDFDAADGAAGGVVVAAAAPAARAVHATEPGGDDGGASGDVEGARSPAAPAAAVDAGAATRGAAVDAGAAAKGAAAGTLATATLSGLEHAAGVDLDPAMFDGHDTSLIIIDDGWSPYYDQSNTVFDYDFSGTGDGSAMEWSWHSHGSWVADVATDVAPGTDIVHLKVFADGSGSASLADVEEALQWSVRYGEAFGTVAVNLSLGFGNTTVEAETRLSDELAALAERNIATTVAAGNDGARYADGVNVLAADPNAIAVSAVDDEDRLTSWSQHSDALTDVAALGEGVAIESPYGWGFEIAGTSFAAPYVAGTTARLQDAADALLGERLSPEEIVAILDESGRSVSGEDSFKVADADAAVAYFVTHHADFADDAFVV